MESSVQGTWKKQCNGKWDLVPSLIADDWYQNILDNCNEFLSEQSNDKLYISAPHHFTSKSQGEPESIEDEDHTLNQGKNYVDFEVRDNNIETRLLSLETANKNLERKVKDLRSRITTAEFDLDDHNEYIYVLEKKLSTLEQYGRRENIEIVGIPSYVSDRYLESEVINILKRIGFTHISHFSFVGCHRIGKSVNGCRNTIVRFLHRKDAINCLRLKKNLDTCKSLGYHNLTIIENLCPAFKSIFEKLSKLKDQGQIEQIWTYNGIPTFKVTANTEPIKIFHDCDIDNFYNPRGG